MEQKHNDNLRYVLTLTEEQARTVSRACELYCRLHIGQLRELNDELLVAENHDQIWERREAAEDLLDKLRQIYFPSLHGRGHSYGVGKFDHADRAWDVHHAIRYKMSWHEQPEGGMGVNFDPPRQTLNEPLPECKIVQLPVTEGER